MERPLFELIAGERRLLALKALGEREAPVVVRNLGDREALTLALIENLQREELNPMDQAAGFRRLEEQWGLTQEAVANAVGKDRVTVANTLRLLKLARPVQDRVARGELSLGHARALLGVSSERAQVALAERAVARGLSVREVERLVGEMSRSAGLPRRTRVRDPHVAAIEEKLQRTLGTRVEITHRRGKGWIRIAYQSLKDLDRLLSRMA